VRKLLGILLAMATVAGAQEWKLTGQATVSVNIPVLGDLKIYDCRHEMKKWPSAQWPAAIRAQDVDKRIVWTILRESPKGRLAQGLRLRLGDNDFRDDPRMEQMLSAFPDPIPAGARVVFDYQAQKDSTSISCASLAPVQVQGKDFMRALWGMYFGRGEWAERYGNALLKEL
jgi:hypothetical protein